MNDTELITELECLGGETSLSLKFELFPNYAVISTSETLERVVPVNTLFNVLKSFLGVNKEGVAPSYKLPPHTYLFSPGESCTHLGMYLPEKVRRVRYGRQHAEEYTIPFPNIIISLTLVLDVKNGSPRLLVDGDPRFFATTKSPSLLPPTPILASNPADGIWDLPMPNMYGSGVGRMCFGSNTRNISCPEFDLGPLGYYPSMLVDSIFNSDLNIPNCMISDPSRWMEFLSNRTEFPYDKLS